MRAAQAASASPLRSPPRARSVARRRAVAAALAVGAVAVTPAGVGAAGGWTVGPRRPASPPAVPALATPGCHEIQVAFVQPDGVPDLREGTWQLAFMMSGNAPWVVVDAAVTADGLNYSLLEKVGNDSNKFPMRMREVALRSGRREVPLAFEPAVLAALPERCGWARYLKQQPEFQPAVKASCDALADAALAETVCFAAACPGSDADAWGAYRERCGEAFRDGPRARELKDAEAAYDRERSCRDSTRYATTVARLPRPDRGDLEQAATSLEQFAQPSCQSPEGRKALAAARRELAAARERRRAASSTEGRPATASRGWTAADRGKHVEECVAAAHASRAYCTCIQAATEVRWPDPALLEGEAWYQPAPAREAAFRKAVARCKRAHAVPDDAWP